LSQRSQKREKKKKKKKAAKMNAPVGCQEGFEPRTCAHMQVDTLWEEQWAGGELKWLTLLEVTLICGL
jgi:hypothetical protein